jgi:hypothetical protein
VNPLLPSFKENSLQRVYMRPISPIIYMHKHFSKDAPTGAEDTRKSRALGCAIRK